MSIRRIAWECIDQVINEKKYANLTLRERLNEIDFQNRGLITQIVYGTLRNYRYCQFQWEHFAKKKVPNTIIALLNMSVYQLFMLDTLPDYAIVNEAVELAPKSMKGFVNAILHQVIKQGMIETEDCAIKTSHDPWIYRLWSAHYGEEIAQKICEANLEEAKVHGRLNTLQISKEEFMSEPGVQFLDDFAFVTDFNMIQHPYFEQGKIIVQDFSSQQVVRYLDAQPGMIVLDCCAAPGTKTSQIAMMMENQGEILAGDIHPHRVELIEKLMEKLHVKNVNSQCWDATKLHEKFPQEKFDRILADVPCSGLGVLSRKPEIKYTCKPEDIDEICAIQQQILQSASGLLKKEGILVYSTCTLNKKENEKQIQRFLENNPNFRCIEEKTIFPFFGHGDGFYIAKIAKKC